MTESKSMQMYTLCVASKSSCAMYENVRVHSRSQDNKVPSQRRAHIHKVCASRSPDGKKTRARLKPGARAAREARVTGPERPRSMLVCLYIQLMHVCGGSSVAL